MTETGAFMMSINFTVYEVYIFNVFWCICCLFV